MAHGKGVAAQPAHERKLIEMEAERWGKVKRVFQIAVERDSTTGRQSCAEELCAGDADLKLEVDKLLASDAKAHNFIEKSFNDITDEIYLAHQAQRVGQRIGAYRIVRQIAAGGMGSVFLAERDDAEFERQVAIKIIKPDLNQDFVRFRFVQERQILASLDHPNIARLIDGGTTDEGIPYLVMEYVEGVSIDEYCEDLDLSVDKRLDLFEHVCTAVHHAHQHLVIHRDLKPSNILVTADGLPKLLDFGIAMLLTPIGDDRKTATTLGYKLMTPEYASPEQILGRTVSTASDVYSLGVILYKLLTGIHPFRDQVKDERTLLSFLNDYLADETQIKRPSSHLSGVNSKSLTGDLDNIVLKAMQKDPQRRYASVEQFAEDIRRHKRGLPVIARPDTLRYRLGKFVKRNRLPVGVSTLFMVLLVASSIITGWQAHVANRQRALAERRFQEQREVLKSFISKYHDAIENLPGSTAVREMLVKDATAYFDRLAQDVADDDSLKRELALAYMKVGDVQGMSFSANLGDTQGSMASYRKAVALLEDAATRDPDDKELLNELRDAYYRLGRLHLRFGELEESMTLQKRSLQVASEFAALDPSDAKRQLRIAWNYLLVGDVELKSYNFVKACDTYRRAITIAEPFTQRKEGDADSQRALSAAHQRLALCLSRAFTYPSSYEESQTDRKHLLIEAYRNHVIATEIAASLAAKDPLSTLYQRNLAVNFLTEAGVTGKLGNFAEALDKIEKARQVFASIARDEANWEARYDLALINDILGDIQSQQPGRADNVKPYFTALSQLENLSSDNPLNGDVRESIYHLKVKIGDFHLASRNFVEALRSFQQARLMRDEPWAKNIPGDAFRLHLQTIQSKEQFCLDNLSDKKTK